MYVCMSPLCDLDNDEAIQSFCKALWPMKMHHYPKFGYKRFSSSKDIVWTNTTNLNLCCDHDFEHSYPIICGAPTTLAVKGLMMMVIIQSFYKTLWLMMMYHHTKMWLQKNNNKKTPNKTNLFTRHSN